MQDFCRDNKDLFVVVQSRLASGTTHPLHTLLSHHVNEQHPERYHLTDMKNPTT